MDDPSVRVERDRRAARGAALVFALALWPACTSGLPEVYVNDAPLGGTGPALGQGGSELVLGQGGGPVLAASGSDGPGLGSSVGGSAVAESGSCQLPALRPMGCVAAVEVESNGLCNGLDDDCDGAVDEGCPCKAGEVQPCFLGAPGRRGVGACSDGSQVCLRGGEFAARWGECTGGIRPSSEACDGLDNDCNGCTDDLEGCAAKWTCPGPGDPRTPAGAPLTAYPLRGRDFFTGVAKTWSWSIRGGPCDDLVPSSPSFTLDDANFETATFRPSLSGDYTVTLTVTPDVGAPFVCSWIVHILGPGLRIEMCYPESRTQDLDLYVKQPGRPTPWFTQGNQLSTALDQCSWANCEAILRGNNVQPSQAVPRADWGYPKGLLTHCANSPQGAAWVALGYCASPRLDIDNNLDEATGVPENINVDEPRDNETFRVMVANFSGPIAHPMVNVYCDGRRTATIGAPPDQLTMFVGSKGSGAIGALWRAADVTTHVIGGVTTCTVEVVHPPGSNTGFDVTVDDPRY